jgi:hypothetical protein
VSHLVVLVVFISIFALVPPNTQRPKLQDEPDTEIDHWEADPLELAVQMADLFSKQKEKHKLRNKALVRFPNLT